jgi:hypothetical protein
MTIDRYVVLGVASARAEWFRRVAQWADSGSLPIEFVKCVSVEELRARLGSGRPHSAVLADGGIPDLDRDLVALAASVRCPVIAVRNGRAAPMGATAVLRPEFEPAELLDALSASARPISRGDEIPLLGDELLPPGWRGRVVMVCGPGGTGASTAAIALAQGLGDRLGLIGRVVLADLALRSDQAMLHDARDLTPSVQELAEAHRVSRPTAEEVRAMTFAVTERGYDLLLGLRRSRAWTALRPRAFEAAFDALQRCFHVVVCDTDSDVEGETEGGSMEVEERHLMARTAARAADVVFVVGVGGMKGSHGVVRVIQDLADIGVPRASIVPVVNRAPRSARARSEQAATIDALLGERKTRPVVILPERRVDEAFRDGVRLPRDLIAPLVAAYDAVVADAAAVPSGPAAAWQPVKPGTLATWGDDEVVAG